MWGRIVYLTFFLKLFYLHCNKILSVMLSQAVSTLIATTLLEEYNTNMMPARTLA